MRIKSRRSDSPIFLGKGARSAEADRMQAFPAVLLAGLLFLAASPLFGQANPPQLAEPHPELYHPANPPVGELGLPLGTFAVVEGVDHPYGMGHDMVGFEVQRVNGKKLDNPRHIPVDGPQLIDGQSYVLHGYELGAWAGEPLRLPKGEDCGAQVIFCFRTRFTITSIGKGLTLRSLEKAEGIGTSAAKPLDPAIPLPVPNFKKEGAASPPIGRLGLPLGTFAIIEVRAPRRPVLMENPFAVVSVNGRVLTNPPLITIPNANEIEAGKTVTMHGFECGDWAGQPPLPDSEFSRAAPVPQQSFQFFPKFVLTSAPVAP